METRKTQNLIREERADAIIEATILFPIIILVLAMLILVSTYLPTRAILQNATQRAATMIATEYSDSFVSYDAEKASYRWASKDELPNVYTSVFRALGTIGRNNGNGRGSGHDDAQDAEDIVNSTYEKAVLYKQGSLTVEYSVKNYVVYKEITVTAREEIDFPINLSWIGLDGKLDIVTSSSAVVHDGDEFIRDMDLAADVVEFIGEKTGLDKMFKSVGDLCSKFNNFLSI